MRVTKPHSCSADHAWSHFQPTPLHACRQRAAHVEATQHAANCDSPPAAQHSPDPRDRSSLAGVCCDAELHVLQEPQGCRGAMQLQVEQQQELQGLAWQQGLLVTEQLSTQTILFLQTPAQTVVGGNSGQCCGVGGCMRQACHE